MLSSLFMHRFLLATMTEKQFEFLQNTRAMAPYMFNYDITGDAKIRNGSNISVFNQL